MSKKLLIFILLSLFTNYYLLITTNVYAQSWQVGAVVDGNVVAQPANPGDTNPGPATFKSLEAIFANILKVLVALGGVATFIMIIVGGYLYMFSGGDQQKSAQAKGTLTWGIIGLLLLIGAWFIMRFIELFTGVTVTNFIIPS